MILHESVEQDLVLIPQRGKESVFEDDRGLLLSVLVSFLFTKANGIATLVEHTADPQGLAARVCCWDLDSLLTAGSMLANTASRANARHKGGNPRYRRLNVPHG